MDRLIRLLRGRQRMYGRDHWGAQPDVTSRWRDRAWTPAPARPRIAWAPGTVEAEELLETADVPIEQVAHRSGFGTAAALREQFVAAAACHRGTTGAASAPPADRHAESRCDRLSASA